jgi:ATP-dependent DNA helicase RecG
MNIDLEHLNRWLRVKEDEHLEFKEAKHNFHFEKLVKYCAALSNEGGGSIVLGVTDSIPRRVVGTTAFMNLERTKAGLVERLRLRIDAVELPHAGGRVLVFTAPPRPIGVPILVDGAYWMRAGGDLTTMTPDLLRRIFDETGPDYSAEVCRKADLSDLAPEAIVAFRTRWHRRTKNGIVLQTTDEQLLRDAELTTEEGVTYAALILLGTNAALGRLLAQAETIFEYRSGETPGPANQRSEFREGFLLYYDRLWDLINLRNDRQHYQDGLFMLDIPTFNEGAIREAVLNAVAHRDYRHAGSIFIRQFPRRIEIVSPGSFPQGITPENILDRQQPRNRRIADALARCGLVERAGQGANRIFESCIRESKPLPDFTNTDAWQVSLALSGQVQDPQFVKFLEKIGQETGASFDTHDFLLLDLIHRKQGIPENMKPRIDRMVELGGIERIGRGRGVSYLLSRRFYAVIGKRGEYTRRKGLDRKANKALLLKHIEENTQQGAPLKELAQVLPAKSKRQIQGLLKELQRQGRVYVKGKTNAGRWFPAPVANNCTEISGDEQ